MEKRPQISPALAGEGACKKHVQEGVVVGRPRRGVRAEPVGRGDWHADIPTEGLCKYAAVQDPPGAGSLGERPLRAIGPHT